MPQHQIHITSELENIEDACAKVKSFLAENGIGETTRINVEIALTETFNNIIEHGYNMEPGKPIDAEVEVSQQKIILTITDSGKARDLVSHTYKDFDPSDVENLPERGFGLIIIDRIADSTEYTSKQGVNKFTITISPKPDNGE